MRQELTGTEDLSTFTVQVVSHHTSHLTGYVSDGAHRPLFLPPI